MRQRSSAALRGLVLPLAVAALSITLPAAVSAADSDQPTPTAASSEPAQAETSPLPNGKPLQPGDEVIQSWTVVPGGTGHRTALAYESEAGLVVKDSVSVQNYGNVPLNLRLYATDGINTADGKFALLPGDQTPTDVGSWVSLAQGMVTVPAGQQVLVPYTLTIPVGADPGDHAGGIVASSEVPTKTADGNTVILSRRTGVRLYLRVRGELRANLVAESMKVSYRPSINPFDGTVRVRFRIVNRGNVRQAGTYRISIRGALGSGKHDLGVTSFPELLPGQSVEVVDQVGGVPGLLVAHASVVVTPAAGGDAAVAEPTKRSASAFAAPILFMLIVVLGLAVLVIMRLVKHRREDVAGDDDGPNSDNEDADREPMLV